MDLFSIKIIKELLKQQEARPQRGLGQNFLISKGVLGDILKAAQLTRQDTVLEIGPGIGTLTRALALIAKKVIAVEKDPAMVAILKGTTKDLPNVKIVHDDILKLRQSKEFLRLSKDRYKVVANLPYYITSPMIRLFLEAENKPELLVFMVQKEVAQRICAKPRTRTPHQSKLDTGQASSVRGKPPMNLLAVSVQFYAKPEIVSYVKKGCFWPQPKVDSAILKIIPHNLTKLSYSQLNSQLNRAKFFEVVRAGFKQPRKQLLNNFSQELGLSRQAVETWLSQVGIAPTQRAETLSIQDWVRVAKSAIIEV